MYFNRPLVRSTASPITSPALTPKPNFGLVHLKPFFVQVLAHEMGLMKLGKVSLDGTNINLLTIELHFYRMQQRGNKPSDANAYKIFWNHRLL